METKNIDMLIRSFSFHYSNPLHMIEFSNEDQMALSKFQTNLSAFELGVVRLALVLLTLIGIVKLLKEALRSLW